MSDYEWSAREALYAHCCLPKSRRRLYMRCLREFIRALFRKYEFSGVWSENTFIQPSMRRKDYNELFDTIYQQCHKSKGIIKCDTSWGFSATNIKNLIKRWPEMVKLKAIPRPKRAESDEQQIFIHGRVERMAMFLGLIDRENIKTAVSRAGLNQVKNLIVLNDVWPIESGVVQIANQRGIHTIVEQHAFYSPNIMDADYGFTALNYWCVPSRTILAWGRHTELLFNQYSPKTRVVLCGNPVFDKLKTSSDSKTIGLALDFPTFHRYNQQIIDWAVECAKRNDMKIIIRFHPADRAEDYRIDDSVARVHENLDAARVILAHTTTMLFAYSAQGKKVLRLESEIPFVDFDKRMTFSSCEELYRRLEEIDRVDCEKVSKKIISCIGNESKETYRKAFDALL